MNMLFEIGGIVAIIGIGFLVWFFAAIGWLALRFGRGSGPNFLDNIIMFPLIVLKWFSGDKE